jgi:transposase InsO family protein
MSRGTAPYPPEFRAEAVRLTREPGHSTSEVARDLGIGKETLRRWLIQAEVDAGEAEGLTSEERTELTRLRRENRTLRTEREILKKAAQYTSIAFGRRCREAGISLSMGSTGDCFDNAMAESFFASLETELIDRSSWRTRADARLAVFDYIEAFYNPRRRHSALGYLSPAEFERRYRSETIAA